MSEDKHLKEREKLEAEIERSLSVAKMKQAHKQIEDIEKLRKQASIKSISERISFCLEMNNAMINALKESEKGVPNQILNQMRNWEIPDSSFTKKYLNSIIAIYESIYFDFQRTIDIKQEDFNRLFPKPEYNFNTYALASTNLTCLNMQLVDMKNYCLRLL